MLRYEPAFECGKLCNYRNNGHVEYTKHELDEDFGCDYISRGVYTATMHGLEEAQAADGPGEKDDRRLPSTGALGVFALAPSCAEVHFYGFNSPKPPYIEAPTHDMASEHQAFQAAFPHAVWH
jgi:hypothetical protein